MKKITSIFLIILTIIFMCGCDAETSNNAKKFSAKEGSQPGIAIIGDCTVEIVGTPEMNGGNSFYHGYQSSNLCVDITIANNGKTGISYDDLDFGISAMPYGVYGGWMILESDSDRTVIIPAGSKKTYRLLNSEEDSIYNYKGYLEYDLEISICYNDEDITKIVYPAGTYM